MQQIKKQSKLKAGERYLYPHTYAASTAHTRARAHTRTHVCTHTHTHTHNPAVLRRHNYGTSLKTLMKYLKANDNNKKQGKERRNNEKEKFTQIKLAAVCVCVCMCVCACACACVCKRRFIDVLIEYIFHFTVAYNLHYCDA